MANLIKFPFGDADVQSPVFAATLNQSVADTLTIIKVTVTAAITDFSINVGSGYTTGSQVKLDIIQDATGRNVTFGATGNTITAPALVGVANDRDTILLTWDGTAFVGGVWEKVVDAV